VLVALALGACCAPDILNFAGGSPCEHVHRRSQHSARTAAAGAEGGLRKMEDLCTGEEFTGTVTKVSKAGATLDMGTEGTGFLHCNKLGKGIVVKASDFISVGDTFQVRVLRVYQGQVDVALGDFAAFKKRSISDFAIGEEIQGTVVGTSKGAVFVDIGAMTDAILPSGNILDFDASTQALPDLFKQGQELAVKVAVKSPQRLEVSMK